MIKKLITIALLAGLLLVTGCFSYLKAQEPPMKFMFGGNYTFSANTGGTEINFVYDIDGRFFLLASVEVSQAISGIDAEGYGKMYSGASVLGFDVFRNENFSISVLGGQATQIYAFLNPFEEQFNRTYVEAYGGAMFTWTPGGDGLSLYISGQGVTPIKDVVIETDYNVSVGVSVPFGG